MVTLEIFWKTSHYVKNAVSTFWATIGNIWTTFASYIWSHWNHSPAYHPLSLSLFLSLSLLISVSLLHFLSFKPSLKFSICLPLSSLSVCLSLFSSFWVVLFLIFVSICAFKSFTYQSLIMSTKVGFKRELLKLKATRLTHLDPATTLGYSLLDGIKEATPFKFYFSFFFSLFAGPF